MPVECPKCGSDDIEAQEGVQADGDQGTQNVTCNACDFEWNENWKCDSWYPVDEPEREFAPDEKYSPK